MVRLLGSQMRRRFLGSPGEDLTHIEGMPRAAGGLDDNVTLYLEKRRGQTNKSSEKLTSKTDIDYFRQFLLDREAAHPSPGSSLIPDHLGGGRHRFPKRNFDAAVWFVSRRERIQALLPGYVRGVYGTTPHSMPFHQPVAPRRRPCRCLESHKPSLTVPAKAMTDEGQESLTARIGQWRS
jgi:hypothetical protein